MKCPDCGKWIFPETGQKDEKVQKYVIKYWYEFAGPCLWAVNDLAHEKYDYAINYEQLPISKSLANELYELEEEYQGCLDWSDPRNPSPWTKQQKEDFRNRANITYQKLVNELGEDYEVINAIDSCIY